jgi:hypothetical protein
MRLTCPACHAETSLEALIGREVDARAVAGLLERHLPMGDALMRYIALFRPPKRRLGLARMVALVEELLPDIERHAITRKGREWRVEPRTWRLGFDAVLAARDKGVLVLPLTSHGYLYEVLCGAAEKAESALESQREADRRNHRAAGMRSGPRDLSTLAGSVADAVHADAPAPAAAPPAAPALPIVAAAPAGPSRAALAIREQMRKRLQERTEGTPPDDDPSTTGAPTP